MRRRPVTSQPPPLTARRRAPSLPSTLAASLPSWASLARWAACWRWRWRGSSPRWSPPSSWPAAWAPPLRQSWAPCRWGRAGGARLALGRAGAGCARVAGRTQAVLGWAWRTLGVGLALSPPAPLRLHNRVLPRTVYLSSAGPWPPPAAPAGVGADRLAARAGLRPCGLPHHAARAGLHDRRPHPQRALLLHGWVGGATPPARRASGGRTGSHAAPPNLWLRLRRRAWRTPGTPCVLPGLLGRRAQCCSSEE